MAYEALNHVRSVIVGNLELAPEGTAGTEAAHTRKGNGCHIDVAWAASLPHPCRYRPGATGPGRRRDRIMTR
jgi:hypothetical protein